MINQNIQLTVIASQTPLHPYHLTGFLVVRADPVAQVVRMSDRK